MSFWYNVDSGKVETDANRSRGEQVLGPYATEAEAQSALDRARAKTEKWDSDDRDWQQKGAAGGRPSSRPPSDDELDD